MSNYSAQAILGGKASQLSSALNGKNSPMSFTGFQALTPAYIDDTLQILPANGNVTPALASTVQLNLPKNSTLIGKCFLEVTLSAGTTLLATTAVPAGVAFNPDLPYVAENSGGAENFPAAEYNKSVGDLILDSNTMIYGNTNLQNWDGTFQALWRRICKNDINIEWINAYVLGNLSPGGNVNTGSERVLADAFYRGVVLDCPLDELFFAHNLDCHWMPEAYALEGQLNLRLAQIGQIVSTYTRGGVGSGAVAHTLLGFTAPTITDVRLRYTETTVTAAEKDNLLKIYRTPEGKVQHWLDIEFQKNLIITGTGARAVFNPATPATFLAAQPNLKTVHQLNNLRMDMAELVFCVHRVANTNAVGDFPLENGVINQAGFGGSYMEGDTTASIMFQGAVGNLALQGFSTLIDITSFQITAAGKALFSSAQPDLWNRGYIRKQYHMDAQIVGAVYCIPFARFPEDFKNATGHMSASVLGALQLEINLPNPGAGFQYQVDLWSHSHNLMQSRAGGIGKALN